MKRNLNTVVLIAAVMLTCISSIVLADSTVSWSDPNGQRGTYIIDGGIITNSTISGCTNADLVAATNNVYIAGTNAARVMDDASLIVSTNAARVFDDAKYIVATNQARVFDDAQTIAITNTIISGGLLGTNALSASFYSGTVVGIATGTYARGVLISVP